MDCTTRLIYGHTTLDLDSTQAALVTSHAADLCRRRRTAVHTVYAHIGGSAATSAVRLVIGHGIAMAIVPIGQTALRDDTLVKELDLELSRG